MLCTCCPLACILLGIFLGRGQVSIQKGKKKEPFRAAFSKVKDLRSFLPGVPILALTASVKLKDRASLWKACGMVNPLVVDVSPNKDNVYLGFKVIKVEAEALNRLKWVATMVERERQETPQTIIFCKTFTAETGRAFIRLAAKRLF